MMFNQSLSPGRKGPCSIMLPTRKTCQNGQTPSSGPTETAELVTPNGAVPIRLETIARSEQGTVDWKMTFPDGSVGAAYSRITPDGMDASIYSFVLMAPPVPLEALEGALAEQMGILAGELAELKERLEA